MSFIEMGWWANGIAFAVVLFIVLGVLGEKQKPYHEPCGGDTDAIAGLFLWGFFGLIPWLLFVVFTLLIVKALDDCHDGEK